MKTLFLGLTMLFFSSCQVTETLVINSDGSGEITIEELRVENSYMKLAGENYSREDVFVDTTTVFKEYIFKYIENYLKYLPEERNLFDRYNDVLLSTKKSSFDKEFIDQTSLAFKEVSAIPDLYKAKNYADDIKFNYALTAEKHYYKVQYEFDGTTFKRKVIITNENLLQEQQEQIDLIIKKIAGQNLIEEYVLRYQFPRKIKSVSNSKAVISSDKKSIHLTFLLTECLRNPESTAVEVILENKI
ncbi:hypothetical protein [Flavobacterium sp. TAB 87]|uniref:hypothetical protein n=1 Tax=Flavobacterium sp. TAB 87 TaxID=1729581 RepID=UPI00076C6FE8|nr:hypothetical protein [Flavobacterium sp. TAB 87]KVV14260.1 hypothetical protein AP058_02150 [Flavobacterium sp. TAB 87]